MDITYDGLSTVTTNKHLCQQTDLLTKHFLSLKKHNLFCDLNYC